MTAHIYTEADAPIDPLKGKRIAVIGYGSQGHAHALNAHDSGLDVMVGLYQGSKSWAAAEKAGLKVAEVADATRPADVRAMLAPDETGNAWELAFAYGNAVGSGKAGLIKTTFKEETETDLFGEQSVLCGGITSLIKAGWEVLVEAGYQPEVAYYECLNEMKLIV